MSQDRQGFIIIFFIALIFALSVTRLVDTDAFTHLNLGREMFNHRGFPEKELFNYPSLDNPAGSYNEWLFGLVLYFFYLLLNVQGVILFKASVIALTFYILLKDSFLPRNGVFISLAVLFFTALFMRHRFIERPDIMLMLFLSVNIYCLNAYVRENRPYLYVLPLVQMIWANTHPSISLMIIPFIAFVGGGLLLRIVHDRFDREYPFTPSYRQIVVISAVFVVSLLASLVNPDMSRPLSAPVHLVTSSWWMDEITELQPPSWGAWKAPFIFTAFVLISFVPAVIRKKASLIHLLLVLPFIYIGLSGIRFVFLIGLVGGPIAARNISALAAGDADQTAHAGFWAAVRTNLDNKAVIISLAAVISVVTTFTLVGKGPFVLKDKVFGLRTGYEQLPEGALKYLDERGIYGRLFNTFQWGGYITWRDHPRRMTFVDGRGGVSPDLKEALGKARFQPHVLNDLSERYGFEVVLLHYNPVVSRELQGKNPDVDLGLFAAPKQWALVYWDDISMVYLKRTPLMEKVITPDEYHHVRPANGYPYLARRIANSGPEHHTAIITELERNLRTTGSRKARLLLGFVYTVTGNHQKTIELLTALEDFEAYQLLGSAYEGAGELSQARRCYKKALAVEASPKVLYSLGRVSFAAGAQEEGLRYLEQAVKKDAKFLAAYPLLMDAYRRRGDEEKYLDTKAAYEAAFRSDEQKAIFDRGLKFSSEGKYAEAVLEFKRFVELSPSNPVGHSNLGFAYFMTGRHGEAYREFQQTLEIAPGFPNAVYGLGLVHKKQGEVDKAKERLREYLKLEPKGAWARKAREELRLLEKR